MKELKKNVHARRMVKNSSIILTKIFGLTLDKQLNFQEHVNKTEKKASIALHSLMEAK